MFLQRNRRSHYRSSYFSPARPVRYRVKSRWRFIAILLALLLSLAAVYVITSGNFESVQSVFNIFAPTPTPTPSPTPAPTPTPTPTPPPPGKAISKVLVVVDPGHGGVDPGTTSFYKKGFYEKEITLDMGLKLRTLLLDSGVSVLMTRETDTEVYQSEKYDNDEDVRERPRLANAHNATFFISIHVNAFDIKKPKGDTYHGTEIYYYAKTHGEYTSNQFAEIMGREIHSSTDTKYNGTMEKNLGVLRISSMPALLVETAYISNKEDHERLESEDFRNTMAQGIHNGIMAILKRMGAYKENDSWYILTDIEE